MKTLQRAGIAALVVALVAALGSIDEPTTIAAHASTSCDDSMINGVYTALWTSLNVTQLQTQPKKTDAFIPASVDGIVFFDGSGHLSTTGWTSFGGTYAKFSFRGDYHVNPDCSGHLAAPRQGLSYDFILVHHGDVLNAIDATGTAGVVQLVRDHE